MTKENFQTGSNLKKQASEKRERANDGIRQTLQEIRDFLKKNPNHKHSSCDEICRKLGDDPSAKQEYLDVWVGCGCRDIKN